MNSLSKPELAMHKLKGDHKFNEQQMVQDPKGDWVGEQTCTICGYKKRIVDPYGERGAFMGTSTAYVSAMSSSMPFYSTTQLRQAVGSGQGSYSPLIIQGVNNQPEVTYEYDES